MGTVAPSNITINGVEYSPDDAQALIELGSKTRELEGKWNTKLDNVWPEYGKSREELKQTAAERDQLKQELESFKAKQNAGTDTSIDREKARQAAKELGFVLDDDIKDKFVSKEDLDKYLSERDLQKEAVNKVLAEASDLEKTINGEDGRPKFNKKQVLAYAQAYKFDDLTKAYEDMHKEELDAWKETQLAKSKGKGLKTLTATTTKKEPGDVKFTDDNVKDALHEILSSKQ